MRHAQVADTFFVAGQLVDPDETLTVPPLILELLEPLPAHDVGELSAKAVAAALAKLKKQSATESLRGATKRPRKGR